VFLQGICLRQEFIHPPLDGLVGGIYFFGKAHTIKFHQGAAIEFDQSF